MISSCLRAETNRDGQAKPPVQNCTDSARFSAFGVKKDAKTLRDVKRVLKVSSAVVEMQTNADKHRPPTHENSGAIGQSSKEKFASAKRDSIELQGKASKRIRHDSQERRCKDLGKESSKWNPETMMDRSWYSELLSTESTQLNKRSVTRLSYFGPK